MEIFQEFFGNANRVADEGLWTFHEVIDVFIQFHKLIAKYHEFLVRIIEEF